MVFSLVEVLLSAPLLHHAVEAVAVAGEGGQLVEAAPGEDLGVPGDQEIAARPQALVPAIIRLTSRQPPEVVTAAARPPLVILLRGEGVAVIAVIVVESVPLLIVSLAELVMVATGGPWVLTRMVTKLIALIMIMVIVITTVV